MQSIEKIKIKSDKAYILKFGGHGMVMLKIGIYVTYPLFHFQEEVKELNSTRTKIHVLRLLFSEWSKIATSSHKHIITFNFKLTFH